MKIAVASQNRREITAHTGRCRRFWIFDIEADGRIRSKQLLELDRSQTFHESSPHGIHPLNVVQVLISGGMGNGMRRRLASRDIVAVATTLSDPDAAVAAWLDGTLEDIPAGDTLTVEVPDRHGHAAAGCGCGGSHRPESL
jgi:predicted Fe-Mo cluster-binding NifX family protein